MDYWSMKELRSGVPDRRKAKRGMLMLGAGSLLGALWSIFFFKVVIPWFLNDNPMGVNTRNRSREGPVSSDFGMHEDLYSPGMQAVYFNLYIGKRPVGF